MINTSDVSFEFHIRVLYFICSPVNFIYRVFLTCSNLSKTSRRSKTILHNLKMAQAERIQSVNLLTS
ncbi:unnamed protein product [Tenebrio molitor]|nr:unnamed protein product [Tenebrio molitor]